MNNRDIITLCVPLIIGQIVYTIVLVICTAMN